MMLNNDSLQVVLRHSDLTFSPVLTDAIGWSLFAFIFAAALFFIVISIKLFKS